MLWCGQYLFVVWAFGDASLLMVFDPRLLFKCLGLNATKDAKYGLQKEQRDFTRFLYKKQHY